MDKKIIFVRTSKGEGEFKSKTSHLSGDIKRVLGLIDDKSTVEELTKRAAPSLRASFDDMLQELTNGMFIQDKDKDSSVLEVVTPKAMHGMPTLKMAMPDALPKDSGEELDFIGVMPKMTKEALAAEEAKAKAQMAMQEQADRARLAAEAKAHAEAEGKAKQEAEAKARAEAETVRLKAEQEAAKAKADLAAVQAKAKAQAEAKARAEAATKATPITAQARVEPHAQTPPDSALKARGDEEARQLAESQAGIWAEAERRAKMQAQQAEAKQQTAQQAEKTPPAKAVPRVAREPRKPLPWGKIIAGLLGLFVALAVLLPYVWPMQDYIAQVEQRLSAQLQQPVRIGHMRPSLLPLPKLELQNVAVGSMQELQAGSVVLHFDMVALFTDTRLIGRAEIGELTLRAESFDQALSWMQAAGGDANYPVAQMVLQRARVSGGELNLPTVNGVVNFDGQGRLVKAVLNSEDGKLSVELKPQPQQPRWQIALTIKESSLPLVPGILFDELNIKGEAGAGEANLSVIEGMLYKGKMLGSARLTWRKGWQMQGQLNVKSLALQDALPQAGMTGELDGNASFTLRAAQLPLLAKAPQLDGRFSVKKGFINSVDMVETARVSNRQGSASAGRTHFDELSGILVMDGNSLQLHQIKISAGVMSAHGFVDVVSGKQLSGRLDVDLKMRAEMGSMPLTLSGTLTEPVWRTGR